MSNERIAYLETIIRNLLKADPLFCDYFLNTCRCIHCGASVNDDAIFSSSRIGTLYTAVLEEFRADILKRRVQYGGSNWIPENHVDNGV